MRNNQLFFLAATVTLFGCTTHLIAGNVTLITAPSSVASFVESAQPTGAQFNTVLTSQEVDDGTGQPFPPTLLPSNYIQGSTISSGVDTGPGQFRTGQNPSDSSSLLTATYQGSISQNISFESSGMNLQLRGSSVLGASNTLAPGQSFQYVGPNHGPNVNAPNGSQMQTYAQLQTFQNVIFSVNSQTTLNLHFSDAALSLSPGLDLLGNTSAYVTHNFTIQPLQSTSVFQLPSPANGYNLSNFQNPYLTISPPSNLTSFQFFEQAQYGTQLDQSGATIALPGGSGGSWETRTGGQYVTGQNFSSSDPNYAAGHNVSASVTLTAGYVYLLYENVQSNVTFGGNINGVFEAGSGTYLDPSTGFNVDALEVPAATVPEPSSFWLLGVGGIGLSIAANRRRRIATA